MNRNLVAVAALAATLCLPMVQAEDRQTVLIGTSHPLSGPEAPLGLDGVNGVRLAIEDLNAQDLRIGGRRLVWKLDSQDDQGDPRQAATIAGHFIDVHVSGVVGPMNSGTAYAASRLYARAGIPMITGSATDPKLARQGFNNFFRTIANDDAIGVALAGFARDTLHLGRVAVIDDRTAYGQGVADAFVRDARSRGLEVVAREYTNDRATDFSAILTRIKARSPDAIMFGGVFHQAGPMLVQIDNLGMKVTFLGGDAICNQALTRLAGRGADMTYCAEGGLPIAQMPRGRAWKARYDARFGAGQFQLYSPYTYDATMVLARAMIKAQSTDPAKYLPMIRDVAYDGVTRKDLHFDREGNVADPAVVMSRFQGGDKRYVGIVPAR